MASLGCREKKTGQNRIPNAITILHPLVRPLLLRENILAGSFGIVAIPNLMHHANFNQPNENKILFVRPSKRIFIMMQIHSATVLKGAKKGKIILQVGIF